jgi:antirestriction protein ArdC
LPEIYYAKSVPTRDPVARIDHAERDFGRKSWGDEGYSREELVAELESAFLCADLKLHQEPREENAAYIAT